MLVRSGLVALWIAALSCSLHVLHGQADAQLPADPPQRAPEAASPQASESEPPAAAATQPESGALSAGSASQAGVSDAAQTAKLEELKALLAEDERMTRRWWRTWSLIQAALIIGQTSWGYFIVDDKNERAGYYLNAGASGVGLLSLLVLRPPALKAQKRVLSLPEGTPEERARKLRAAEEFVEESGQAEEFNTGWAPYTGGTVVGLAVALPLWLKFDRRVEAALSFVGSIAFTTVQTLTTPVRARNYRRAHPVEVSLGVSPGGLVLTGTF